MGFIVGQFTIYLLRIFKYKILLMKKLLILTGVSIIFCSVFSACKSHEKCPAYSKANTPSSVKKSI